jgi:hypothetical protein
MNYFIYIVFELLNILECKNRKINEEKKKKKAKK